MSSAEYKTFSHVGHVHRNYEPITIGGIRNEKIHTRKKNRNDSGF